MLAALLVVVLTWRAERARRHEQVAAAAPATPTAPAAVPVAPGGRDGDSAGTMFTFVDPVNRNALDAVLPAPAGEIHYVQVNRALAYGKRSPFWQPPGIGRVDIPLPDGRTFAVTIDHSEMLGPDRFTSAGRIAGRPNSRALFAWNRGFLHASFEDAGVTFMLRVATEESSQFYQVDPAQVPPCGGERRPRAAASRAALGPASTDGAVPATAAAENPQRAEVHVLLLYTNAVLPTLSGSARVASIESAFDLAIANVNSVFDASQITARVKLVRVAETNYDESKSATSKIQDEALTALYRDDDGQMDEIHALRDQVGADIVCLALNRVDAASSGLSFLLDEDDLANSRFAFSVVQYTAVGGTTVLPHELGHVFGCAHDRENAGSGAGAYSFSYGYRFTGADGRQYRDLMAYPPGSELSFFSNPNVIAPAPANAPLGIVAGRAGESNCALTIERTAFRTAAFRLQTQAAPNTGSLINVATRGYVGTGEEVLIGGFVVQGATPKQMLIRGAGPALRSFGVTSPLGDPRLRIYTGGTLVAENENWTVPVGPNAASAGAIEAAAVRASAFGFPAGSADAAVLVTLPPGAYTAIVEGERGATGSGLVEAYEVERNATRIANLATRGYIGRDGKELVGGFVVEGFAGMTKRILVRVLGPTLGRAPYNLSAALDDPEMELRSAAGDVLLTNDDWSTGSEGGVSLENDFRPLVALYGEKQIFATGFAPQNRREPCVLVDLPPGSYTVIVRPFEYRSSDPELDQPATPGVGVVEVYEIRD